MNAPRAARGSSAASSVAAGAAAFLVCLALTPSFPGDGDAAEFTLALALRGVPHPTGYPLYVLLGSVWTAALHAAGVGWAHAANAWSAAGAGVACGLLHALALRLLPDDAPLSRAARSLIAAVPVALLLFCAAFLREATIAEVGSWQVAAILGLALAAHATLEMLARPAGEVPAPALRRPLFWTGLAAGTALANHATSWFFVLPVVATIAIAAARARRLAPADVMLACAGAALPLLSYLHVAWRAWHPAAWQWELLEPNWASVASHVTGRVFAVYVGRFAPRPEDAALLRMAVAPLVVPGLALAIAFAVRERLSATGMLFGALAAGSLLQLGFVFRYGVPDAVPYFLPLSAVAALAIGAALSRAGRWLAAAPALAAISLVLCADAAIGVRATIEHHRTIGEAAATIRARWDALPFERGIVLWNSDHYAQLLLLGLLDGRKPGVIVANPATLTWPAARRQFQRRTGIDPLAGLELQDDSQLPLIAPNIARQGPLPVVDFATWRPGP